MTKEQLDKLKKGQELSDDISYLDRMMDMESLMDATGAIVIPKKYATKEFLNIIHENILSMREQYQKEFDEL